MLASCSFNKFKVSCYPTTGKPSVFTKYATSHRNVIVCLAQDDWPEYSPNPCEIYRRGGDLIQIWRKQIKILASMSNLQFLQLDVNSMAWWLFRNRQASTNDTTDNFAGGSVKRDLLASLSLDVRKKEGPSNRGIWITGSFGWSQTPELGEAWRDLGLNLLLDLFKRIRVGTNPWLSQVRWRAIIYHSLALLESMKSQSDDGRTSH